jgi:pilus assembly protein CpaD
MQRSALKLSLALLLGAAVSGCGAKAGYSPHVGLTSTEQFAITVQPQPERIQLAARTGELSPAQVQALAQLAERWRADPRSPVVVEAPAGAQNAALGARTAAAAARVLGEYGVPPTAVVSSSYPAAGQPDAAVQVSFTRLVATAPNCATFQSDFAATFENQPFANFGCAVTANFAAQIADPRDLLNPQAMTPADATRRGIMLDTYRAAKPTGTPRSSNPSESARVEDAQR